MEPIVMEISKLNRLKSLHFEFYEDNTFQGTPSRSIVLYQYRSQPESLVTRAVEVSLCGSDVEVSSICNRHRGAFEDLKILYIGDCQNMGHLASISQDEIQYSLQLETCFSKLTSLEIVRCFKMKYLFCNSIANSMVQLRDGMVSFPSLEKLEIGYLPEISVIWGQDCSNDN
ncbi:hypothetical protein ACET3Z_009005 [Daucus carota]